MRTLVVNCSAPSYNLGAEKLANWLRTQGDAVATMGREPAMFARGYDRVCLSVIFSWHVDRAIEIALAVKDHAEVWVGGPGLYANHDRFTKETAIAVPFVWRFNDARGQYEKVHGAPDLRFDRQPGEYRMIYAMRGCPIGCSFCIVPMVEGKQIVLDPEFYPAKMLCDNNLSAAPIWMQNYVIDRYIDKGVPLMDANSGFEPRSFNRGTRKRWERILRGAWRFALDEMDELDDARRMMRILSDIHPRKKRVYCLLGYEPMEQCYERAQKIIEWGGEPFCQVFIPLNYADDPERLPPPARHDWPNRRAPYDMRRYFNSPQLWRSIPIWDYRPRQNEPPPFERLRRAA